LLIVGCGDVGQRVIRTQRHVRVVALTSSPDRVSALRAQGVTPVVGNLDVPRSFKRLSGWATRVLHLAPPPLQGTTDPRTLALSRMLMQRTPPRSIVYGSTSGVYGDCAGEWVNECRLVKPTTPRAQRRVDAERRMQFLGRMIGRAMRVSILRIPGIYALDREGGTPRERLMRGMPVLKREDDVFTNHIHANDLARACQLALWRGQSQRTYNVNDDTVLLMGDYMDLAAEQFALPKPARISRAQAQTELPAMQLSFMSESRRMVNTRMKRELRLQLHHKLVKFNVGGLDGFGPTGGVTL
jgi:nucleoside-diphosphate-sugar epimerase